MTIKNAIAILKNKKGILSLEGIIIVVFIIIMLTTIITLIFNNDNSLNNRTTISIINSSKSNEEIVFSNKIKVNEVDNAKEVVANKSDLQKEEESKVEDAEKEDSNTKEIEGKSFFDSLGMNIISEVVGGLILTGFGYLVKHFFYKRRIDE